MRQYVGYRDEVGNAVVVVHEPGREPRALAHRLVLHSPSGFEWGYHGSGPADLAANILYAETGDEALAKRLHQQFKEDVIANLPEHGFNLTAMQVRAWLRRHLGAHGPNP